MFHLAAFGGAKTDSTANENVPAVTDNGLNTSSNSRYFAPENVTVFAATIMNDAITRARITAPSLRNEGLPEIYPVTVSDDPATNPVVAYWGDNGPRIRKDEEFGVECSNGASTVDRAHAALFFRAQRKPVPPGKRLTIVGTSAQTLLLDAWTLGGITLDQTLPVGNYAVIGMHVTCNDAWCARLVFPRASTLRPGCPVAMGIGGYEPRGLFRCGEQGEWGRFSHNAQPLLELIGNSAGAETATIYLDLVQLEGGAVSM